MLWYLSNHLCCVSLVAVLLLCAKNAGNAGTAGGIPSGAAAAKGAAAGAGKAVITAL
jgi:hypothetical protein